MKYVSVAYKNEVTGEYTGRAYSYTTELPLKKGDKVIAPTYKGNSQAMVVNDNVPEGMIDERWADKLRAITQYQSEEAEPDGCC